VRDDAGRLRDILDAIDKVGAYAEKGRHEFEEEELVQVWIVHHIQVIGEAARGLSPELRATHPEVPWSDVVAMRNLLVHEYFGIDLREVWDTAVNDIPPLRAQIQKILTDTDPPTTPARTSPPERS
jgi:uncharacterized protein with HEPN domain